MSEFSIQECISFGWRTFKTRAWFFIGVTAVLILAGMLTSIPEELTKAPKGTFTLISVVGSVITILLSCLVATGQIKFTLIAHDAPERAELHDLWYPSAYWRYLGAALLVGIVTIIGFILLIVPGVIISIALCMTTFIAIDQGLRPIAAMRESLRITKGHRWALLGLVFALLGINIIGVILLLVGLLATLPISLLACIHAYRMLQAEAGPLLPLVGTEHVPVPEVPVVSAA